MSGETLKFLHIVGVILFFASMFGSVLWKACIEFYHQDPKTLIFTNKLLLAFDGLAVLPSVALLYFAGRWLADAQGLHLTSTPWIANSILCLGISGVVWGAVMIPLEVLMLRWSLRHRFDRLYRRAVWLWLVSAVLVKVFPLYALWMMVTKS